MFARLGRTCVYCGAPAADVDHVIPVEVGGSSDLANLVPACTKCNRGRRD